MNPGHVRLFSWKLIPLVLITGVVFWALITRVTDDESLRDAVEQADPRFMALACGLMAAALGAATARLRMVLGAMGYGVGALKVFDAIMSTWPLGLVAPSRTNEFLRAFVLRNEVPVVEGGGAVLAERAVDVQTLCLLALVGAAAAGEWLLAAIAGAAWLGVWAAGAVVAVAPDRLTSLPGLRRFEDKLSRLTSSFGALHRDPRRLAGVLVASLGVWLAAVAIAYVLLTAFAAGVSFVTTLSLWPLAIFVGLLPVTVSGMGTRDATFVALLALQQPESSEARVLAATMGYAVVTTIIPAAVGIPWMIRQLSRFQRAEDEG